MHVSNRKAEMATNDSGEFEKALQRLEAIVQELEGDNVGLDKSVELFKEGKALARRCEELLKNAQSAIEASNRAESEPRAADRQATGDLFGGR